ncbi:MAG: cytochrome o ubiquinol oxidase subunit IV [Acuticoccus sp.]
MNRSSERRATTYLNGFALAVVLTAIPFIAVWTGAITGGAIYAVIAVCAVIQVVVHLVFFLHIDFKETPGENLFFLGFAAVLIFLMVGGTLWIMIDLHHRMG